MLKLQPARNEFGQLTAPARVRLIPADASPMSVDGPALPVDPVWLARLQDGDRVTLRDARDKRRTLTVLIESALDEKKSVVFSGE